ncbi:MAG: helix-turn-helix domain-containing protein [Endozoicomonas sp. (ex Botrylloides leachii)]|nr:helix-turn-helix domain-containing protein [Endozoicomonas sp. (ex Botrylloides leachii)]
MELNQDTQRKYLIIYSLVSLNRPSLADLHNETSIPEATLKRQIALLRKEYQMDIQFVRHKKTVGKSGYYVLVDWGIIHPDKFLTSFGGLK